MQRTKFLLHHWSFFRRRKPKIIFRLNRTKANNYKHQGGVGSIALKAIEGCEAM